MNDKQSSPSPSLDITTLLASSIHDIKNSLGILLTDIDGVSDFLNTEDKSHQQALLNLKATTRRLNNELTQLLVLYRLKTNTYNVNPVFMDISSFIEDMYQEHKIFIEAAQLELKQECVPELYWNFDPMLVSIALNNALNNAQRYAKKQIILSAKIDEDMLCIQIRDDGAGFPEAMLQDDIKSDLTQDGTGVGIYFCNEIACSHYKDSRNGQLEISNNGIGGGGCVSLYFP